MEIGLEQKKRDRAAMYIKGRFEFRNNKAFTDNKFVREEGQEDRILKSSREAV